MSTYLNEVRKQAIPIQGRAFDAEETGFAWALRSESAWCVGGTVRRLVAKAEYVSLRIRGDEVRWPCWSL